MQAVNRSNVSQYQARSLMKEALSIAEQKNLHISVAVVDWSGDLVAFSRSDSATKITIDVAIGKAKTSALIQESSKLFESFINNKQQISMSSIPNIIPLQGGLPINQNGQFIGAIGVSGAPGGELDELIAHTTLEKLNLKE
jgi:glc operon protein GlcG